MVERIATTLGALAESSRNAFATGPFGSSISSKNFTPSGLAMLRGSNLSEDVGIRLDEAGLVFLPDAYAHEFPRSLVRDGDLVFTCWGTVGQIGLIDAQAQFSEYLISNKQMKMTPDSNVVSSLFLYYYLSQTRMVDLVRSQAIGSSVPGFNLGQLRALPLSIPRLEEQFAIAEVLGALDDKIAANTKLASTADRLARENYQLIARGAGIAPLSSSARFVNGRAFTKGATGTGRVVVRIAELNSGITGSTVYNDIVVASENTARPGDLLFAWSGSLTLHRWYRDEAIVNQHIFKVIPNVGYPMWLVNQLVLEKLDEFKSIAADKATTMGHIQRRHLDEPVRVPSSNLIAANDVHMNALWNRALVAERENVTLAATRDALLPQLMSGKLRVKEAERIVSEVA